MSLSGGVFGPTTWQKLSGPPRSTCGPAPSSLLLRRAEVRCPEVTRGGSQGRCQGTHEKSRDRHLMRPRMGGNHVPTNPDSAGRASPLIEIRRARLAVPP